MLAIYKKELGTLFHNLVGWLYIAVMISLFGTYFFLYHVYYGYPYIAYTLMSTTFIFLLTIPVLCMRTLAGERQKKTDQLLMTSTVSLGRIVLGKFLAISTIYTLIIAFICVIPVILQFYGDIPVLQSYVAILGFWLYGLCCIAIGIFSSSITDNPIIAAIISFALLFYGYMMGGFCGLIAQTGSIIAKILSWFDIYQPLLNFMDGKFSVVSLFYFLSIIVLALFLAYENLQKRRFTISTKTIDITTYSILAIVLAVVGTVLSNLGMSRIPLKYTVFTILNEDCYMTPISIGQEASQVYSFAMIVGIPAICLIVGIYIWLKRRKK